MQSVAYAYGTCNYCYLREYIIMLNVYTYFVSCYTIIKKTTCKIHAIAKNRMAAYAVITQYYIYI